MFKIHIAPPGVVVVYHVDFFSLAKYLKQVLFIQMIHNQLNFCSSQGSERGHPENDHTHFWGAHTRALPNREPEKKLQMS